MKLYISADIEGTTGIARWDETETAIPAIRTLPNR